jgi:hypothetical protein
MVSHEQTVPDIQMLQTMRTVRSAMIENVGVSTSNNQKTLSPVI